MKFGIFYFILFTIAGVLSYIQTINAHGSMSTGLLVLIATENIILNKMVPTNAYVLEYDDDIKNKEDLYGNKRYFSTRFGKRYFSSKRGKRFFSPRLG